MAEINRDDIKQKLATDPHWRLNVLGKKWVCPYTGSLAASWSEDIPDAMVDEVIAYLRDECPAFDGGNGELIPLDKLKLLQFTHEAKHRLRHDEAWRVKLQDGRWICPYTGKVTDIMIRDDEPLTRNKFQEIVDYLTALPEYDDGAGETKPQHYLKARQSFFESPNWKVVSPNGKWISPFSTKETDVDYNPEERDLEAIWDDIWKHLSLSRAYNNGKGVARPLNELTNSVQRSERLNELARAVAERFQSDFRYHRFSAQALWECPFCGTGVGNIKQAFDNPVIVRQASVNIAKHLLYACRVFGDKKAEDVPVDSLPGLLDSAPETSPAADAVPLAADDPFSMPVVIAPKGNPDGESEAIPVPADEGEAVAIAEPMEAEAIAEPVSDQANAHAVAEAVPAHAIAEPTPAAVSRRVSSEISRVIEERHADTGGGHGHGGGPGGARDKAFDEARRKQLRMLPEPPEIDGLECAVVYQPCDMVGGDFYDFIELPNNRLGIVQGDVSGHGLEVWGDMTMAMKTLRIYARQSTSAREMLVNANEDLVPDLMAKTFVSGFYCILDLETFKMKMARAGHNPLILFNPDRKPQSLIQYEPRGMVLGMARGNMFNNSLEELEIQLYSGDMLLWYTDGVTETMNPDGDEYGIERFCSVIEQHGRREAEYLLQQIMDAVGVFREGAPPDDDVTLVAVRII